MKITYRHRLFLVFVIVLALYTAGVIYLKTDSALIYFIVPLFVFVVILMKSIGTRSIEHILQLRTKSQVSEKTRQLKQEMTGNIAHELRTPVTSIRGYLETVLAQPLTEEQKHHFLTQAYNQTIVLSELIQDMSLLTKLDEASHSFKLEAVNLPQLMDALKRDLMQALQEKDIDLQYDMPTDVTVQGNRNLLYAIFRNLTDNAIRYAGEHIRVRLRLTHEDTDFYTFTFYDTGVGIPAEIHLDRLFERFYRINEGRTRDTGGSGLGLSIVKNAIAFHKGTITATNRIGGGLEFRFRLHK